MRINSHTYQRGRFCCCEPSSRSSSSRFCREMSGERWEIQSLAPHLLPAHTSITSNLQQSGSLRNSKAFYIVNLSPGPFCVSIFFERRPLIPSPSPPERALMIFCFGSNLLQGQFWGRRGPDAYKDASLIFVMIPRSRALAANNSEITPRPELASVER